MTLSYDAQISTDAAHGLIVGMAVTQAADGGYTTRENIKQMAEREIDFVGSMNGKGCRAERVPEPSTAPTSAFIYDRERDAYLCRKASH